MLTVCILFVYHVPLQNMLMMLNMAKILPTRRLAAIYHLIRLRELKHLSGLNVSLLISENEDQHNQIKRSTSN